VIKTMCTLNGFRIWEYGCKHKLTSSNNCSFRGRVFYSLPDDAEYVCYPKGEYKKVDCHSGLIVSQTIHRHTCGQCMSWTAHLDQIKRWPTSSPKGCHRPWGWDGFLQFISSRYDVSDDVNTLFPQGCKTVVMNQIRLYWSRMVNTLDRNIHCW
jgi:hypothetical protein